MVPPPWVLVHPRLVVSYFLSLVGCQGGPAPTQEEFGTMVKNRAMCGYLR